MIKYHSFARTALAVALGVAALGGATAFADDDKDFGQKVEQLLKARSEQLFGVEKPVEASAPPTSGPYRNAAQSAWD
jgi:hypothetical protein